MNIAAAVDGDMGGGWHDLGIEGLVTDLEFKGYRYDSLSVDGHLRDRTFVGSVDVIDPNLDIDISGLASMGAEVPQYGCRVDIHNADLARMNINRRDSISQLRGRLYVDVRGASLDSMNGMVTAEKLRYIFNGNEIGSDRLTLRAESSDTLKRLDLTSDFANVVFESSLGYKAAVAYLKHRMQGFIPSMKSERPAPPELELDMARDNGHSLLSVKVADFSKIADAIMEGLEIKAGTNIELRFNPVTHDMRLSAGSSGIRYRQKLLLAHMQLSGNTLGTDSLELSGSGGQMRVARAGLGSRRFGACRHRPSGAALALRHGR